MNTHTPKDNAKRPDPPVELPEPRVLPPGQLEAIVAIGPNGLIGRGNELPWRSTTDMAMFRSLTWGKTVLVGSSTWASIARALPGRNIAVLSRTTTHGNLPATVAWMPTIDAADQWAADTGRQMIVAGGTQIYALTAPRIGCWWRTDLAGPGLHYHHGDATIPDLDPFEWCETWRSGPVCDGALTMTFARSHRRQSETC